MKKAEKTLSIGIYFALLALIITLPKSLQAEVIDFGGHPDSYTGDGDQTPPRCQVDLPRAAESAFFIQWGCSDNDDPPENLRSELWIFRNGETTPKLIGNFFGFPASVQIDSNVLGAENFGSGLPVSFRLIVRDRAGVAAMTDFLTVRRRDNSLEQCTLNISTDSGTSSVAISSTAVNTQEINSNQIRLITPGSVQASPCEITSLCTDGEKLSFESSLSIDDSGTVNGTIAITPGSLLADLSGSAEFAGARLESIQANATGAIDGETTSIQLNCSQ